MYLREKIGVCCFFGKKEIPDRRKESPFKKLEIKTFAQVLPKSFPTNPLEEDDQFEEFFSSSTKYKREATFIH